MLNKMLRTDGVIDSTESFTENVTTDTIGKEYEKECEPTIISDSITQLSKNEWKTSKENGYMEEAKVKEHDLLMMGDSPSALSSRPMLQEIFLSSEGIKADEFFQKTYTTEKLMLAPYGPVIGRGIEIGIKLCQLYIAAGSNVYALNLGEDRPENGFMGKIPDDTIFFFMEKTQKTFIMFAKEGLVYPLADDIVLLSYFETEAFQKRNRFYGRALRDLAIGLNMCNVISDPRDAEAMYRFFTIMLESDLEERRLGQ